MNPFIDANRRIRNGWWLLIFWLVMAPIGFPILIALHEFQLEPDETSRFVLTGAILLVAAVICQWLRKRPVAELGLTPTLPWWRELAIGGLLGAVLMLLPAAMLWLGTDLRWQLNPNGVSALLPGLLLMAAVAFAEEVLYRGFMFQRLIDGIGVWPAQLLMAAFFMLSHWNNPAMTGTSKWLASLNIFTASLLFGLAYIKTRRLTMPIGIHLMANWVQGPVLGFGVSGSDSPSWLQPISSAPDWLSGGAVGLEASVPGLAAVCALTYCLYRWSPPLNR
ncbi:CPBP family intramembrane metalloprotease [Permianibacter sp. IMCC34836]|uniref:CPBP family intramembrane glutamic endopeptidase n=1 Tax=Permianibacter fluminis TaxID=2738515 RepID=UPI00155244CB|nr:type II CAAX endopeptidase family protein [Permianibacter fluminis]NQD37855.1 CPBP family intramembrane metalloprotease [Permianibacter fluminis]